VKSGGGDAKGWGMTISHRIVGALGSFLLFGSLGLGTLGAGGCSVWVGEGYYEDGGRSVSKISESRMRTLMVSNQELSLGMEKGEALSLYPDEYVTLKSSSRVDGRVVEEWRVLAYQKRERTLFKRWLYFLDGELVEFSDDRLGYSAAGGLPSHWVRGE